MKKIILPVLAFLLFQESAQAGWPSFIERNKGYQGYDRNPSKPGTQLAEETGNMGFYKFDGGMMYISPKTGTYFNPSYLDPITDPKKMYPGPANDNRPPLHIISRNLAYPISPLYKVTKKKDPNTRDRFIYVRSYASSSSYRHQSCAAIISSGGLKKYYPCTGACYGIGCN